MNGGVSEMPGKVKAFCAKHREFILFYVIGSGTIAIAWGSKYLCDLLFFGGTLYPTPIQNTVLSIVETVSGIAYAYPTNRKWVFRSTDPHIPAELLAFTASRLAVVIVEWLLNMLLVSVLKVNIAFSTVLAGFVGANINFVLSRLMVFGKGTARGDKALNALSPGL